MFLILVVYGMDLYYKFLDQSLDRCEDGTVLQMGFCMSVGGSGRGTEWVNVLVCK